MLQEKIALVTGSSRGIGKAVAEKFASLGATVYAVSRTAIEIGSSKNASRIIPISCDVCNEKKMTAVLADIKKEHGRLDILVNNAGIMQSAVLGMITRQSLQESFETNVFSLIQLTQTASRIMKKQMQGSIINLASVIGVRGYEGQSVYAATKGAVISFTLSVSKELAKDGIRVNAIAPGTIETDLLRTISDEKLRKHLESIKMGRFGKPEEVAHLAAFFASDYSKYITGQVIGIDGGTII